MVGLRSRQSAARIIGLYRQMWRIRKFEEVAGAARERGDAIGAVHMSTGQEAVSVGVCANLKEKDIITSTHRGHGHVLAKGSEPLPMMCELYGRKGGICGGKGGSMHIADFSKGIFGANGVVAAGLTIAVGAAHAVAVKKEEKVVVCFFGDGAINRGPFLEGLNWAAVYNLPIVFVCEDNGFAATTRTKKVTAGPGVAMRAQSLGLAAHEVDGNDILKVDALAGEMIAKARSRQGPSLLHARTFRLMSHWVGDKRVYRTDEELKAQWELEPIARCAEFLRKAGIDPAELKNIENEAGEEMAQVADAASSAAWPSIDEAFADVQDVGGPSWRA